MNNPFWIDIYENPIISATSNDITLLISILTFLVIDKDQGIKFAISATTIIIINQILKSIIQEPLPVLPPYNFTKEVWEQVRLKTYSMPSGHTTFATALIVNVIIRMKNFIKNKIIYYTVSSCLVLILAIKCCLIWYFGYHFIQDVIVAIILTLAYAITLERYLFNKKQWIVATKKFLIVIMFTLLVSMFIDHELRRLWPYSLFLLITLFTPLKYLTTQKENKT